jgi:hypothetical protein
VRFLPLVEETLLNPRLEVEKSSPSFWPAEGGISFEFAGKVIREGGCNRKTWYRLKGYKKDGRGKTLKSELDQQYGHFFQGVLTKAALRGRFYLGDEVPIRLSRRTNDGLPYDITGSVDLMYQDPMTGRPALVEAKSTGSAYFGQVHPTKEGKMAPGVGHAIQCLPYLAWARDIGGIEDPQINIVYADRGASTTGEHVMTLGPNDQAVIENDVGVQTWDHISLPALYADFDRGATDLQKDEPPPRPYMLRYDNNHIRWMYENGLLNKTDTKKVEKFVESDPDALANDKPPVLVKGDFACNWCDFAKTCYGSVVPNAGGGVFSSLDSEGGASAAEVPV